MLIKDTGNVGYKWTANKLQQVFIVELQIIEGYSWNKYLPYDFVSKDCIVKKIYRLSDGKIFPRVMFVLRLL